MHSAPQVHGTHKHPTASPWHPNAAKLATGAPTCSMRLATTVGRPSGLSSAPSAPATSTMSVRSATSSAARPRSASLSRTAASYSSPEPSSPCCSTTAVAPPATAASSAPSGAPLGSSTSAASMASISAGSCTRAWRLPAGNRLTPAPPLAAPSSPPPLCLGLEEGHQEEATTALRCLRRPLAAGAAGRPPARLSKGAETTWALPRPPCRLQAVCACHILLPSVLERLLDTTGPPAGPGQFSVGESARLGA